MADYSTGTSDFVSPAQMCCHGVQNIELRKSVRIMFKDEPAATKLSNNVLMRFSLGKS